MDHHMMTRRRLLQVSASGLVTTTILGGALTAPTAAEAKPYASPFTWISPRGTIEVMDDYPYWVAKEMGYFGDLGVETAMEPGPSDGTAVVKFLAVEQADIGFPSPGVLSFAINNGMDLVSVFGSGFLDLFNIAFRKGEGMADLKGLEGKTVLLGSAAWQAIAEENPLFPRSRLGVIAEDVANTRVTFRGTTIALSDGAVGDKLGAIFAVKNYPAKTDSLMLDELNLPVDMVVTHSFVPINANIMAGRIKRQLRLMQAANDGAVSLAQELELAQDDLESKRLIFGEHHMTVAVYARSQAALDDIAAEIRNISATSGINLISEAFGARAHFMAQHPGNTGARSRKAAITNHNFADLATFHRTPLGKTGREVPWGVPITLFPTPERSGFRFNFHEQGTPDREPTGGHTLILGRPGSGKSVLAAFLMTMARRAGARLFDFDYRAGMEMAVRALGGSYSTVRAGRPTGLNPLQTEIDARGQAWLADWLASLLERRDRPLTPVQTNRLQEVVRQNASAGNAGLRNLCFGMQF
jgi:hypothetical protein